MTALTDAELLALDYLADGRRSSAATCHIERRAKQPDSASARRMLKRLERRGLVEGVQADRSGRVRWWRITDAGCQALEA